MAAIMVYTSAGKTFSVPGATEAALQTPGHDPFASTGGGSEGQPSLDVSDYISFDEGPLLEEQYSPLIALIGQCYQYPFPPPPEGTGDSGESSRVDRTIGSLRVFSGGSEGGMQKDPKNVDQGMRYIFRTKSERDVLVDGYKWRKYGKKQVKNTPYPRNYFRCLAEGCCVKKRVERDREDSSYVLTTYEGNHCHPPPGEVYNPLPHAHNAAASATGSQWGISGGSFEQPGDPA